MCPLSCWKLFRFKYALCHRFNNDDAFIRQLVQQFIYPSADGAFDGGLVLEYVPVEGNIKHALINHAKSSRKSSDENFSVRNVAQRRNHVLRWDCPTAMIPFPTLPPAPAQTVFSSPRPALVVARLPRCLYPLS